MSSNVTARLDRIGEAIDQLAADAASGGADRPDELAGRLAAIWAMMAELDPALARKLPGYTSGGPDAGSAGPP